MIGYSTDEGFRKRLYHNAFEEYMKLNIQK